MRADKINIATYHFTKPMTDYKDWETFEVTIGDKKEVYTMRK